MELNFLIDICEWWICNSEFDFVRNNSSKVKSDDGVIYVGEIIFFVLLLLFLIKLNLLLYICCLYIFIKEFDFGICFNIGEYWGFLDLDVNFWIVWVLFM